MYLRNHIQNEPSEQIFEKRVLGVAGAQNGTGDSANRNILICCLWSCNNFSFRFWRSECQNLQKKSTVCFLGLNGANHRNRFLNYWLFCWKFGVIGAPVGKEKRCDSHYLQSIRSICIVLSHKSTYFMAGEVSICTDKPCVTQTHARYELYCPKPTFCEIHLDSVTTGFTLKLFYFRSTDRPDTKLAILTSDQVKSQIFCFSHWLYSLNEACA